MQVRQFFRKYINIVCLKVDPFIWLYALCVISGADIYDECPFTPTFKPIETADDFKSERKSMELQNVLFSKKQDTKRKIIILEYCSTAIV